MKCLKCNKSASISNLCESHFLNYYENKIKTTIKKYDLFSKKDKILVAASGGKDSTAILYVLHKLKYNVTALLIDEGIKGYRDVTIEDLKRFCMFHNIKLNIVSFEKEFGFNLDNKVKDFKPCTVCGVLRRRLINQHSFEYDVVVTGHNLDDESQSVIMNIFRNNLDIMARQGPKTGLLKNKRLTTRVKPLYFLKEKENLAYTFLKGFSNTFVECPYANQGYRSNIRVELNKYEAKHPGTKLRIVNSYLKILPKLKKYYLKNGEPNTCNSCNEITSGKTCKTCSLLIKLNK